MFRKLLLSHVLLVVAVLLLSSNGVWAQSPISVTSSDLLGLIGKSQTVEDDTIASSTSPITVNLGTAGTNRTWDFRTVTLKAERFTYQFISPAGTPFANRVPQSNFVMKATSPTQLNTTSYIYSLVSSTAFRSLGVGSVSPQGSFFHFASAQDVAPLALNFNATWTSTETDTSGLYPTFAIITTTTSNNTVDAWGVVRLPIGDFNCLRVRENNTTVTRNVFNGVPGPPQTTTSIDYTWISKSDFFVAAVSSKDNETNPNYTAAAGFSRLFSRTTAVETPRAEESLPADFALAQNYPNPFNPATEIAFQLARAGQVEVAIYNVAGEKVRTLMAGHLSAGKHTVKWDGKNERGQRLASGAYLYRLQTETFRAAKKMLLLQ